MSLNNGLITWWNRSLFSGYFFRLLASYCNANWRRRWQPWLTSTALLCHALEKMEHVLWDVPSNLTATPRWDD